MSAGRHGAGSLYAGSHSRAALRRKADRIRGWLAKGRSVYLYFNNDASAKAVASTLSLKELRT
ncbi:MAG: DUF72 domain-containing protein [candidate division NC10 bacterium]